jgi:hypothetical protein
MGNSLLDVIVFGRDAGRSVAKKCREVKVGRLTLSHVKRLPMKMERAGIVTDALSPQLLPTIKPSFEEVFSKCSSFFSSLLATPCSSSSDRRPGLSGWGIKIKGIELGTAGVLLVALVFGHFGYTVPASSTTWVLAVRHRVGFMAAPNSFAILKTTPSPISCSVS